MLHKEINSLKMYQIIICFTNRNMMSFGKFTDSSNIYAIAFLSIDCAVYKKTEADAPRESSTFVTVFIASPKPVSILEI